MLKAIGEYFSNKENFGKFLFIFENTFNQYETQRIYKEIIDRFPVILEYCPDKYKTRDMCEELLTFIIMTETKHCRKKLVDRSRCSYHVHIQKR